MLSRIEVQTQAGGKSYTYYFTVESSLPLKKSCHGIALASLQPELSVAWKGLSLSAPFRLATCDWNAKIGVVPWKSGKYDVNGFNVTNLSLRATKAFEITKSFGLDLFGQVVANPAYKRCYFVFGLSLKTL